MPLKRTYQVQSKYTPYSKRARTLGTEVTRLKKQVNQNKKELKYYDGFLRMGNGTTSLNSQSFITDVFQSDGTTANNPVFVGRKVYIKKMEVRAFDTNLTTPNSGIIYRERRQGKNVIQDDNDSDKYPTNIDPEYHVMLRHWDEQFDADKKQWFFTINFSGPGRLLEFDEQNTAVAQGAIVSGDIKASVNSISTTNPVLQFRCWYTDG